jgi:uncharacterized protein (DUF2141 family)
MKKFLVVCVTLLSIAVVLAHAASKGTITVVVTDLNNNKGRLSAVLFNDAEAFPKQSDKAVQVARSQINDKTGTVQFDEVPYGEYAIVILHDENSNGKMDYSTLGMPEEGYGFSNNAKGMLGPPDYKDAMFVLDKPEKTLTIKAIY